MTTAPAPPRPPRKPDGPSAASPPPRFSSRRPLLLGFLTLTALAAGLVGWGAFASLSGAVIAAGRVEVETRDQVVEHFDGGTVGAILVRDGTRVAAGDVLLRLDDARLRSEAAVLEAEVAELAARRNRLEAEFRDARAIVWDAALIARAEADAAVQDVLDGQQRLFEARRSSQAGQMAQLRERIGQMRKQIAGLEAQTNAVRRQRRFVGRELHVQRVLFKKGLTELPRLLELEREAARLDGQAGDITARIAGARGRIAEIEIQILQIGGRRVEEAEGEAREVQARETQVRERLTEVQRRLAGMEVRAPVAGEVYGMQVFAHGEVVHPGEPILHIVPAGAALMVLAQLAPIHVDQVYPDQEAVLRFSAFPARITPEFAGRIRRVSADAVHDADTGLDWYEVEVTMGRAIEPDATTGPGGPRHARDLALTPGMPVEVYIRTGERSPLSYLAKPLTDYFARALREE